jgi:hypothetical protein
MTKNYNRTHIFDFNELPEQLQTEILEDRELSDAHSTSYVVLKENSKETALPLDMFMRTERNNNFTHGIYGLSYFSCYCVTFSRCNTEAVISYKFFNHEN